jgi:alkanesulfonate monooxygenase SsuD/methylene tetrahydromethanopterin reductase-like flavin-dependent oxidoreductase (luciferase family)
MTMPQKKPALSLVAVPGRRIATLEIAREIEARGFSGIYCPSIAGGMALCEGIAQVTETIPFGTSVSPIYTRPALDYAANASFIHEVSGGRFRFGIGVSHVPSMARMGITVGKPLGDMRAFVTAYHDATGVGEKPPLILATLRKRMIALAGDIGDGMVFANGARSHMKASLEALPAAKRSDADFFIGNMIPTCITDDLDAAYAVHRRNLTHYAKLPNYRNYWREAGYEEEMAAIDDAIIAGEEERIPALMSERWLNDTTLSGTPAQILDGVDAWRDAGISTPILVPSSAAGNQMKAFQEMFAAFED